MNILRTRWLVYLNIDEGYIYCYEFGWVSTNILNQSEAAIKTFASKEEAQKYFHDNKHIQFIEVNEHIYTQKETVKEKDETKELKSTQVLYEDDEGNYRYRGGFWSGFGDQ